MKLETFSYLPPMTEEEVRKQVEHILAQGLIPAIEYTARPRATLVYWTMWDLPMVDVRDADAVMAELAACRAAHPDCYIKVVGYDRKRQCQVVSFVAYRPEQAQ